MRVVRFAPITQLVFSGSSELFGLAQQAAQELELLLQQQNAKRARQGTEESRVELRCADEPQCWHHCQWMAQQCAWGHPTWSCMHRHASNWMLAADWRPCAVGALPSPFDPNGNPLPPLVKLQHFGRRPVAGRGNLTSVEQGSEGMRTQVSSFVDVPSHLSTLPSSAADAPPASDGVKLW